MNLNLVSHCPITGHLSGFPSFVTMVNAMISASYTDRAKAGAFLAVGGVPRSEGDHPGEQGNPLEARSHLAARMIFVVVANYNATAS